MIPGFPGDQITTDQAPPLALPLSFFSAGMFSIISAGICMILFHDTVFVSNWMPVTLGFTHFGTLGFLGSVMMGSFYQMTPVVAGKPVPFIKLGAATLIFHMAGTAILITGLIQFSPPLIKMGLIFEATGFVLFLAPALTAIFTAPTRHPSVTGMRVALLSLLTTAILGTILGLAHLGIPYPGLRASWLQTHLVMGIFGWIGTLIMAVSWQVIPMFYMTPYYSQKGMKRAIILQAFLLICLPVSLFLSVFQWKWGLHFASWGCILIVWLVHPVITLSLIAKRRRKNKDGSLLFWQLGLLTALVCIPITAWSFYSSEANWPMLAGWVALWGWAGSIVHGMLYRIIPFLIWLHKFSSLVGKQLVPSMKSLLPEKNITQAFVLHLTTLILGAIAITTSNRFLIIATGIGLTLTGLTLMKNFIMAIVITKKALSGLD